MKTARFQHIAVVGANSQIGRFLLPRLEAAGLTVHRIGREASVCRQSTVHAFDEAEGCFKPPLASVDAIISLAPLPSISLVMKMAKSLGVKRLIAFGSTSRFTKAGSSSPIEQDFVAQQTDAERLFAELSDSQGVAWTLFRPTMIYGADEDQNVAFIKSVIRRFRFFPIACGAGGLRQPVHADDLAAACVSALAREQSFNRSYNLGGGERLNYREMVRRIFVIEGKRPLIVPLPVRFFHLLITLAQKLPPYSFVRKEMVERMFQDLTADNSPAEADFGYSPRPFTEQKAEGRQRRGHAQ